MYSSVLIFFSLIAYIYCSGKICDLEFEKCDLQDKDCMAKFGKTLRKWFNKPEAGGYFLKAVDPLYLDEWVVEFKAKKIVFPNVKISGLDSALYELRSSKYDHESSILSYENYFTHGITLKAEAPTIIDLYEEKNYTECDPVHFEFDSILVDHQSSLKRTPRCDGIFHLDLTYSYIKTVDGKVIKAEGLEENFEGKERKDLIDTILKATGELATKVIYDNFKSLLHNVDYDYFFKKWPFLPEKKELLKL